MPIRRQFSIILNPKIWVLTNLCYVMQLSMMTNHCSPIIEMLLSALNSVVRNDFLINEQSENFVTASQQRPVNKGKPKRIWSSSIMCLLAAFIRKVLSIGSEVFFLQSISITLKKKKTDKTPFRCRFGSELLLIQAWTFSVSFQWFSLW